MSNKWLNLILYNSFILFLISCGGGGGASPDITNTEVTLNSIAVTASSTTVPLNFTQAFTATGTYSDESSKDLSSIVFWFSSDNNIATINSAGIARGLAVGTVTITATSGDITSTGTLTVSSASVSLIELSPQPATVGVGFSQSLVATGIFSDSTSKDISTSVTWDSNDSSIATVSSKGLVTGVSVGTTIITASIGNATESILLTVTLTSLSSISVSPVSTSIVSGNIQVYSATGTFSDGSSIDMSSSVTWSSSNTAIATILSTGIATGVAAGSATITATSGGKSGSATLAVTAATLSSIAITPSTASIVSGNTQALVATGTFSNATKLNITKTVTWSSSNTIVATVSSKGVVTGVSGGTATITATSSGKSSSATITVIAP